MKILDFFSKNQAFIILGCLSLAVFFLIDKALGAGILFIFFLVSVSLFFIARCNEEKQRRVLSALFLIIFFFHVLLALVMYYTHFQPFSNGGGDYTDYQIQAQAIAGRVHQGNFSLQGLGLGHLYPVIVGYVYVVTIPSMLIGQLLNAWLVTLSLIFVYLIARHIGGGEKEAFLIGLILCLYPSLGFFGSLLLKDALVVLLSIVGLWLTLKMVKDFSVIRFLGFFVILTGLIHFRFYVGYALMFGFVISWFLISKLNLKKRMIYGAIMVFILGFSPMMLGSGYYGFNNLKIYLSVEKITFYKEIVYAPSTRSSKVPLVPIQSPSVKLPSALPTLKAKPVIVPPLVSHPGNGSSIALKTGLSSPVTFIENTFISFIYAFLGPFPWQLALKKYLFVFPEMILWYFLLFFIVKGMVQSIKKRNTIIFPLIIFSIFVMGVLSVFISNFGIITRIRIPVFLALSSLFPLGFEKIKNIKIPVLDPLLNKIFNT